MLRDRLVCGTCNRAIQRRLLQETALTFDKALEITLSAEAADKDSKRLTGAGTDKDLPTTQIGRVNDRPLEPPPQQVHNTTKPPRSWEKQPSFGKGECFRCGGKHDPSSCRFKQYDCNFCKKRGHLARVCRKRGSSNSTQERAQRAHHVAGEEVSAQVEYGMFHISSGQVSPYCASVTVNGSPISMEIDTGASVSIISLETFESIKQGESMLELEQTPVKLQTYNGGQIDVCGSTQVEVVHKGQTLSLPLIVTQGHGPTLLGRNWMEAFKLDWQTIFRVGNNRTLQQTLLEHSDVFKEELGELRGETAKFHVDHDARPRFHKPRQVPFTLREKVERELERLQALGVIRPVRFSDWAAPIVPVMKSDGRVRICGDYKVTINRAAKLETYPIPRIEELFTALSGGKLFSKLDLSHAYLQVPLDEASRGLFEYWRLPFGVASAPSIFQRVMENLLQGIP